MNPYEVIRCRFCGGLAQKQDADTYQCRNCGRRIPSYYPSDWKARRLRVFQRDHFRCTVCGKYGGELHCDHVVPPSEGGSHAEGNLRTTCLTCHLERHPEKVLKYLRFYKYSTQSNFAPQRDGTAAKPSRDVRHFRRLFVALAIMATLYLLQQWF